MAGLLSTTIGARLGHESKAQRCRGHRCGLPRAWPATSGSLRGWPSTHASRAVASVILPELMRAYEAYDLIDVFPAVRVRRRWCCTAPEMSSVPAPPTAAGSPSTSPRPASSSSPASTISPSLATQRPCSPRSRSSSSGHGPRYRVTQRRLVSLLVADVRPSPPMPSMTTPGERGHRHPRPDRPPTTSPDSQGHLGQTPRQRRARHFRRARWRDSLRCSASSHAAARLGLDSTCSGPHRRVRGPPRRHRRGCRRTSPPGSPSHAAAGEILVSSTVPRPRRRLGHPLR